MVSCLPPAFGVGALLLRKVKSETRGWLEFLLDTSKQLFGCILMWIAHLLWRPRDEATRLSQPVAEATCGVAFQYLLLQALSRFMETFTGHPDFRTGEYRDEQNLIVPGKYLQQLILWLVCVAASEWALQVLQLPNLLQSAVGVLLEITSWSSNLQGLTELLLPCGALVLQFWLTDAFIQKGGLPPWQAGALVIWALASAAGSLLEALIATCSGLARLWPSGPLAEPLVPDVEDCEDDKVKAEASEAPKARGALLRAAVAEKVDFISPPPLPSPPSPRPKKTRLAPVPVADLGPAKAPFQQFQNLSGMFAERDSELKELHEELDELLGGLGLEHLMQTPNSSPSAACSVHSPEHLKRVEEVSAPGPPDRTLPLASSKWASSQDLEAAQGPRLPMPHGPSGPTPRTVWGSPQSLETSPNSPHHAPGSVKSEPGVKSPRFRLQPSSAHPAPAASDGASPRLERKSRRYDVLDRKIDSLLSALGTSGSRSHKSGENGSLLQTEAAEAPRLPGVDEKIQRLQEKMEQLLQGRAQSSAARA